MSFKQLFSCCEKWFLVKLQTILNSSKNRFCIPLYIYALTKTFSTAPFAHCTRCSAHEERLLTPHHEPGLQEGHQAVWEKTRNKKGKAAQKLLTQASKPAALQIKEQVSLEIEQKLKQAKRKQETADTKKSAKKQEADPQIEHPESLKNRLTRIGAECL
jgi:hypothetical protein